MIDTAPKQATTAIDDFLAVCKWGDFAGSVVAAAQLQPLLDAGASAWICVDFVDVSPDGPHNTAELVAAINAADCVIVTRNLDDIDTAIGRLAAAGTKVLVFERPVGVPSPALLVEALM